MSVVRKFEPGTGAAQANASQPTQSHQEQQRNYAFENQTRGASQLRAGDPMDFGMVTYHKDPMDEQIQIRRELMGQAPPGVATQAVPGAPQATQAGELLGIPPSQIQRTMPITDAEIAYAHRWQAQEQQVMRDQAIASMFDLTNPAERDRVMKLFPGYFARQRAFVDSKFAVMRKYIDISMTGIQSEEDADFVYNVKMGLIQLPMGYANFDALTAPMDPVTQGNGYLTGYEGGSLVERGPFNIYQYFNPQTVFDNVSGYNTNFKAFPFSQPLEGATGPNPVSFWGPVTANNIPWKSMAVPGNAQQAYQLGTMRNRY